MALARYQFTVTDNNGNVVPNANVRVREETVGMPLAQLYDDRDGTSPISNPFQADSEGFAYFHVLGGAYQIEAYNGGFSRTFNYVAIGLAAETDFLGGAIDLETGVTGTLPVSSGGTGQVTEAAAIGALISTMTLDSSPDRSADYVATYDASASTGKKVLLSNVGGGAALLTSNTFSGVSSVGISIDEYTSSYTSFRLDIYSIDMGNADAAVWLRFDTAGADVGDSGANDYGYFAAYGDSDAGSTNFTLSDWSDDVDTAIELTDGIDTAAGTSSAAISISLFNPAGTTFHKNVMWQSSWSSNPGADAGYMNGSGKYFNAAAIDFVQIIPSAGTFSGIYRLYGLP